MDQSRILAGRAKVIEEHGPSTAHDIALGHGISTLDQRLQQQWRVDWFDRIIRR